MKSDVLIQKAAQAQRESKYIDFKESFDTESLGEWCELIKDIVAMANSGGGIIVFGVANSGSTSHFDPQIILGYDPAKVTDKLARYTSRQFADFEIVEIGRRRARVAGLVVGDAGMPMIFVKAGTYRAADGRDKTAFQNGTIYFRHGAKSEPADPDDLEESIERQVDRRRKSWLRNVRKIAAASLDSEVLIVPPRAAGVAPTSSVRARIVTEEGVPGVYPAEADKVWPYRGKDLLQKVNQLLGKGVTINSFDIQVIRHVYELEKKFPHFAYRPFSRAPAQYSDEFVQWLAEQHKKDPQFFEKARDEYRRLLSNEKKRVLKPSGS